MKIRSAYIATFIALAALAAGCGGSSPAAPTPAPAADVTINILGESGSRSFAPSPTTVSLGQSVSWKNTDGIAHDIIQDTNSFTTPVIAPGGAANAVTMSARGTFTYHCGIHPSMVGTITVQ
jgi:plastocyanin